MALYTYITKYNENEEEKGEMRRKCERGCVRAIIVFRII
jgi:hypothetical protein